MNSDDKLRFAAVLDILHTESAKSEMISTSEIIKRLCERGIPAERRAVKRDLDLISDRMAVGLKERRVGRDNCYYLKNNTVFTDTELGILIDMVHASNSLDERSSEKLIDKIATLGGHQRAKTLKNRMIEFNNSKHSNPDMTKNREALDNAIRKNHAVSFSYFRLDENAQRAEMGVYYTDVVVMVYEEENYYLVAYDLEDGYTKKHFRIDRMYGVEELDREISFTALSDRLSAAEYTGRVFKMFGGDEYDVTLLFGERCLNAVFDKFGEKVRPRKTEDGDYILRVTAAQSPTFFAWVFQFGKDMKILEPLSVKEAYLAQIRDAYGVM
ncbi:MAG: WYL domain-containing protein [Oscillospiraceae bacterium]|nr:WYL domain-containing protein [Oscillospiraceae bacterium]